MADTGANIGSFGGGFAKGLANILYRNQQQKREDEKLAQARKDELNMKVLGTVFEHGDPDDIEPYLKNTFPDVFGDPTKPTKPTKDGKPGPMDHVRTVLQHFRPHLGRGPSGTPSGTPGGTPGGTPPIVGNDLPSQGGISGNLPQTPALAAAAGTDPAYLAAQQNMQPVAPVAAAPSPDLPKPPSSIMAAPGIPVVGTPPEPAAPATPKRPTLFGVRMQSRDEIEEGKTGIDAKVRIARRMVANGTAKTIDEALDRVGLSDTRGTTGSAYQSIPGTIDGKPAFGVFDRAAGHYVDPLTHEPLIGFIPRETGASSTSMGTLANQAAVAIGFKNASEAVAAGKGPQLTAKIQELTTTLAEARGTGTGKARIATELGMPIGPTAAAAFNVPPTTTLGQLSQVNGLSSAQQQQIASLGQIDKLLEEIDTTLPKVFPTVAPGIWGNLQTQFQLGVKSLAADEDLAKLDAAINASLAQVVQLEGQPGGRISDDDIKLAKATLANLTPSVFGGDTLSTARARLGVLRSLLVKAQAATPTRTTPGASGAQVEAPPGAGGAPGAAPPGMMWNGKAWVFK